MGEVGFEPTQPEASDLQSDVTRRRYRSPIDTVFFIYKKISHPLFRPFAYYLLCALLDLVSLTHKTKNPKSFDLRVLN